MSDLGVFKDLPITAQTVALKNAGDGLSRALTVSPTDIEPGDELDLLVRVKAGNVTMRIDDIEHPKAWTQEITLNALTVAIVSGDIAVGVAERLAQQNAAEAAMRARDKEREKAKKGIVVLPGTGVDKGDIVHVDANGTVLTPAEVAEKQGRGETVRELAAVVVTYDDPTIPKMIWPSEFEAGTPRPRVGDDGVVEVVDFLTGEPVVESIAEEIAAARDLGLDVGAIGGGDDDALSDAAAGVDTPVSPAEDAPVDAFEDPDPQLPTQDDFDLVGTSIANVRMALNSITDAHHLARIFNAEKQGRGDLSEPRSKVLGAVNERRAALGFEELS